MVTTETVYDIGGYKWVDVTNRTACGPSYPLRDVIACGGRVPHFVSYYCSNETPVENHTANNLKEAKNKKPQNKFWVKNPNDRKKNWKI